MAIRRLHGRIRSLRQIFRPKSFRLTLVEIGRIIRFGIVGIIAAIAYVATAFAFSGMGPIVATVIGSIVAAAISYLGHLYFSFRVAPDHRLYLWRFAVTAAITFGMNALCTWLILNMGGSFKLSVSVVIVIIPGISWLVSRFWTFEPGLRRIK